MVISALGCFVATLTEDGGLWQWTCATHADLGSGDYASEFAAMEAFRAHAAAEHPELINEPQLRAESAIVPGPQTVVPDSFHDDAIDPDPEVPGARTLGTGPNQAAAGDDPRFSSGSSVPPGSVMAFAGADAPEGWLLCDGSAVDRGAYADLFDAIGTLHGPGDGSTTFNLPDYRGRVIVGLDNMGGNSANRITDAAADALGGSGGSESHALSVQETPSHSHTGTTSTHGGHTHGTGNGQQFVTNSGTAGNASAGSNYWQGNGKVAATASGGSHSHTFTTDAAGGGEAHPNVQPYGAANYIVKT